MMSIVPGAKVHTIAPVSPFIAYTLLLVSLPVPVLRVPTKTTSLVTLPVNVSGVSACSHTAAPPCSMLPSGSHVVWGFRHAYHTWAPVPVFIAWRYPSCDVMYAMFTAVVGVRYSAGTVAGRAWMGPPALNGANASVPSAALLPWTLSSLEPATTLSLQGSRPTGAMLAAVVA